MQLMSGQRTTLPMNNHKLRLYSMPDGSLKLLPMTISPDAGLFKKYRSDEQCQATDEEIRKLLPMGPFKNLSVPVPGGYIENRFNRLLDLPIKPLKHENCNKRCHLALP